MQMLKWMLPMAMLVGCSGGTENNIRKIEPRISVAPLALDWGEVAVPVPTQLELFISSAGSPGASLTIDSVTIDGDDADLFTIEEDSRDEIPPGENWVLPVTFTPESFLDYKAQIMIESNDTEDPIIFVPLSGVGVSKPLPDLCVSETTLDFGTVPSGTIGLKQETLLLENCGTAPLNLGELTLDGSGAFSMGFDPSYQTISPGQIFPLNIVYEPPNDQGDNGTLTIQSNDPVESEVEVILLGNGGGNFQYPKAIIDCPAQVGPPVTVAINGSQSTDPNANYPLTYKWRLDPPRGSASQLANPTAESTNFFADVAGNFDVFLTVENSVGVKSTEKRCRVSAIPEDKIHVELTWSTDRADMDLHLLDQGYVMFEKPGDCTWCNPSPKWGGNTNDDDPTLDIDDQAGLGPENINVLDPKNGDYAVKVHYFEDHGDAAVTATVNVYLDQQVQPVYTGSRTMVRNEVWDVGVINWPQATFGVQSTPNYPNGSTRQCF